MRKSLFQILVVQISLSKCQPQELKLRWQLSNATILKIWQHDQQAYTK